MCYPSSSMAVNVGQFLKGRARTRSSTKVLLQKDTDNPINGTSNQNVCVKDNSNRMYTYKQNPYTAGRRAWDV